MSAAIADDDTPPPTRQKHGRPTRPVTPDNDPWLSKPLLSLTQVGSVTVEASQINLQETVGIDIPTGIGSAAA